MKLGLQGRYIFATFSLLMALIVVNSTILFFVTEQQQVQLQTKFTNETSESLEQSLRERAENLSGYLSSALFDSLYYSNPEEAYYIIDSALSLDDVAGVYVVGADGNIFHDGTEALLDYGRRYHDEKALKKVFSGEVYSREVNDRLILGKPIRAGNELIGALYTEFWRTDIKNTMLQASALIDQIHEQNQKKIALSISFTAAILIALGIVFSVLIARSMVRPIRELIGYTDRLGKGDFSAIQSVNRQDEIGELANSFNAMSRKLQQRTEEISHQAYHDALTGLPNRARFIEYIGALIDSKSCEHFAVLFIDLDEFKSINDNYGHDAGDRLLQDLSQRMKGKLRAGDLVMSLPTDAHKTEVVARIGGDEFLICLPNISHVDEIENVVGRLFDAIRRPITINNEQMVIGGSIGIACYPGDGETAEELIKNADIAMYQAKANGKNTHSLFTPQMIEQLEKRVDIEREIRKALESPEQFELWYQPQVSLGSQELIGAEALVRWRHPERGLIAPNEFIPVAEERGLIIPLGEWLIEQLCRQLGKWERKANETFYVSLNLSVKQIYGQELPAIFSRHIEQFKLPGRRVHVEVTESFLMHDEPVAKRTLEQLRKLGVEVWMDDFGTGFSSLSYLRRFPVDGLKIDRSFIADIEEDQQDRALTAAIISMANSLDIPVVAEGIEKEIQVELLQQQDCHLGQGYYFSTPLPAEEFEDAYLRASNS